nr:scaffolding protein [Methylophilales phage MEP433]WOZ55707.1 scaffolding protein [Methylophilales phage MEP434]
MVDKVEITEAETTAEAPVEEAVAERPEGLPEKFKTVEDMAKSYAELETKLGSKPEEEPAKEEPKTETPDNDLEIAEKAVSEAGLDMSALETEYKENGELNETSYEALEKAGIPKEYVDAFINGQTALQQQQSAEVKGLVGGEEGYNELTAWASENLTEGEKEAYNSSVNSNNMDAIKLAVTGLKAKFEAANGSEPSLLSGKQAPSSEGGYQSWAQVTEAMADPRYSKDSAYQEAVKAKLANSNL